MGNCYQSWLDTVSKNHYIPYLFRYPIGDQIKRRSCEDIGRTSLRVNYEIEPG